MNIGIFAADNKKAHGFANIRAIIQLTSLIVKVVEGVTYR